MLSRAIICDLDGTLANVSSHRHLVQKREGVKRDFYGFHRYASGDAPVIEETREALWSVAQSHDIILVSGRHDRWRSRTQAWLMARDVPYDVLYMRPDEDYRPDTEVKLEIYKNYIQDRYLVERAYDDRPAVIELWRSLGIPTVVVSGWED